MALNDRLKKIGKRPVKLVLVPDELEDENMIEMVNVGLLQAIVCDDWKATIWKQMLPKIDLNKQAVVRRGSGPVLANGTERQECQASQP